MDIRMLYNDKIKNLYIDGKLIAENVNEEKLKTLSKEYNFNILEVSSQELKQPIVSKIEPINIKEKLK